MGKSTFDIGADSYEIMPAEVLEVNYTDENPELIYSIKAKIKDDQIYQDEESLAVITAIPLNSNQLRLPIVGEIVLLIKAPASYASGLRNSTTIYYLDIVGLQSSIHHNALPSVTKISNSGAKSNGDASSYQQSSAGAKSSNSAPTIDKNFQEDTNIKPLQPYIGDVIYQSRYGSSLRFSTFSDKNSLYKIAPNFSKSKGNPITILHTSVNKKGGNRINGFITEDFNTADNVLIQASGQELNFEQSSKTLTSADSKGLNSWKSDKWGNAPQTLISAGRIIFNSVQKEIMLFAKTGIGLSTDAHITIDSGKTISMNSKKIELGTGADEPLILGTQWKSWMESLIEDIGKLTIITPQGPAAPITSSPQWPQIASYKAKIPSLLSDLAFALKAGK
jgi:hypothetical protein